MGYSLDDIRVLVAEDNEFYAKLLRLILRAWGVRNLTVVADGIAAFQHVKNQPCDIIITDFAMTPITGVELLELIRTSPESPDRYVPVIVLSGYTDRERIEIARDAGATEIMAKPITPKDLACRLEAIVERPRPFIDSADFFGPDRRRHDDVRYTGPQRRVASPAHVDLDPVDLTRGAAPP